MLPRITVVISAFNSEKWLRACLEQLRSQSVLGALEIIVIDSGSEQEERRACREFSLLLPGLTYERTAKETLYAAWNRGLAKARGQYFVNANTDDALHPDALRLLADAMERHPSAALAYGDWVWATVPNASYPWDPTFRRCVHAEYHPSLPLFYAYAGCHQFWRTDQLRELGGFDGSYQAAGDYDALCRLALKRWQAVYVPEAVSAFYQNPNGLSRSSGTSDREFHEIRDRFRRHVGIDDLYDIDPASASACARAWTDLAHRALSLHVPWAEQAMPDTDFAAQCAHKALDLDPTNQQAKDLLALSTKGWRGLIKRTSRSMAKVFTRSTVERPASPLARMPSPVLGTEKAASP